MFHFENLNKAVRDLMLVEAEEDKWTASEYYGKRLTDRGREDWPKLLRDAINAGNADSLAAALREPGRLKTMELRQGKPVKVPIHAAELLAQGEFNRYYIRAVCRLAKEYGILEVEVYRGRHSENPRPESEALIGRRLNAVALLEDLRTHPGEETLNGIPLVGSGLSVRLPKDLGRSPG